MRDDLVRFYALKEHFDVTEIDVFILIEKGILNPFNCFGEKMIRPDRKPKEYLDNLEREKSELIRIKMAALTDPQIVNKRFLSAQFDSEAPPTENEIERKINDLDSEIRKYKGLSLDPYDWVNYRFPDSNNKLDEIKAFTSMCYFKMIEIKEVSGLLEKRGTENLSDFSGKETSKPYRKS